MIATLTLAPLMLAQAAMLPPVADADPEVLNVAYEEIANGNLEGALAVLEAAHAADPEDPATLINLGSVHQQLGNAEEARLYYTAALESSTRYDMELADGRWVDSRRVALMALGTLENHRLAAR